MQKMRFRKMLHYALILCQANKYLSYIYSSNNTVAKPIAFYWICENKAILTNTL